MTDVVDPTRVDRVEQVELLLSNVCVATCAGEGDALARLDLHEGWSVGVVGDRIAYLGPTSSEPHAHVRRELSGACVLPGLVDPHTHLPFAGSRVDELARKLAGVDYRTIAAEGGGIASTVRATREASDELLYVLAKARALQMRAHGVTAIEAKSGYGLSVEHELRLLRVLRRLDDEGVMRVSTTFLGAHALPPERKGERARYLDEVVQEQLPRVVEEGLADAIDVYCDDGAFTLDEARRVLEAGRALGLAVRAHAGQFADLGAAELVAELGGLSADHLEAVSEAGLRAMADAGVVGVFLPGAWRTLRQVPPSGARFRDHGVAVAVGTDLNPGTSPTADLPLAAALAMRDGGLTCEEALLGITRHAARAAGFGELGRLHVGGLADLAVFDTPTPRTIPYVLGDVRASLVVRGGEVVHEASARLPW